MQLSPTVHTSRPWRIAELVGDFRLEDVWALPVTGRRGDFREVVEVGAAWDPATSTSRTVRLLFAARWELGRWFGWDRPDDGLGSGVPSLRGRLPDDLRDAPSGPASTGTPFRSLYLLDDEWAAEIANRTMHGVLHLGWVPDGSGAGDVYRAEMAVYVKPNGRFGEAYMAAIRPFRHRLVYPPMLREWARAWQARHPHPPVP